MDEIEHLTREQRVQRIGELLSKGITLMLMREAEEKQALKPALALAGSNNAPDEDSGICDDSKHPIAEDGAARSILDYLKRVGQASPRDIQRGLNLPKSTVYRYLNRLIQANHVVGGGKTSAIRYRLTSPLPTSDGPSEPRFAEPLGSNYGEYPVRPASLGSLPNQDLALADQVLPPA